jgi:hypothetical protein
MLKVVVISAALLAPVGGYFLGRYHEAQSMTQEIVEEAEKRALVSVRENVRRAEKAQNLVRSKEDTLEEQLEEFTNEVKSSGDCACTANDDELREYNELVQEANRGVSGDRDAAVRPVKPSKSGK